MKSKNWTIQNGGKITIKITGKLINVICNGDTGSGMSDDADIYKKMIDFLLKYTSEKQAKKIMDWVSKQVLSKEDFKLVEIMNSVDKEIFR